MCSSEWLGCSLLFRGKAWAIFDSLAEEETDSYDHLKCHQFEQNVPGNGVRQIVAHECLSQRQLCQGVWISLPATWKSFLTRPTRSGERFKIVLSLYINSMPEQLLLQ